MWLQRVELWRKRVERAIPPEERAHAILDQLDDDAMLEMETLEFDDLGNEEGVETVIDAVKAAFAQRPVVRMGEMLEEYFEKTYIESGEHTVAFAQRLSRLTSRLSKDVNVELPDEVKTYYLLKGLKLTQAQRANVLAAAGSQYAFRPVVTALGVLYPTTLPQFNKDQQHQPRGGGPPRGAKGGGRGTWTPRAQSASSGGQSFRRWGHRTHVCEADGSCASDEFDQHCQECAEPEDEDQPEEDGEAPEDEPEDVTAEVNAATQHFQRAKQRMRNALQARGYFKPDGSKKGGGKKKSTNPDIIARKKDSTCSLCGQYGHWAGDEECSGIPKDDPKSERPSGRGSSDAKPASRFASRKVNVVEDAWFEPPPEHGCRAAGGYNESHFSEVIRMDDQIAKVNTSCVDLCSFCNSRFHSPEDCPSRPRCRLCRSKLVQPTDGPAYCFACGPEIANVHMVDNVKIDDVTMMLHTSLIDVYETLASRDSSMSRMIILDTACKKTISGDRWQMSRDESLDKIGLHILRQPEHQWFRFGPGEPTPSHVRARVPCGVQDSCFILATSTLKTSTLPCLTSLQALALLGMVLGAETMLVSFKNINVSNLPCIRTPAGHIGVYIDEFPNNMMPDDIMKMPDNNTEIMIPNNDKIKSVAFASSSAQETSSDQNYHAPATRQAEMYFDVDEPDVGVGECGGFATTALQGRRFDSQAHRDFGPVCADERLAGPHAACEPGTGRLGVARHGAGIVADLSPDAGDVQPPGAAVGEVRGAARVVQTVRRLRQPLVEEEGHLGPERVDGARSVAVPGSESCAGQSSGSSHAHAGMYQQAIAGLRTAASVFSALGTLLSVLGARDEQGRGDERDHRVADPAGDHGAGSPADFGTPRSTAGSRRGGKKASHSAASGAASGDRGITDESGAPCPIVREQRGGDAHRRAQPGRRLLKSGTKMQVHSMCRRAAAALTFEAAVLQTVFNYTRCHRGHQKSMLETFSSELSKRSEDFGLTAMPPVDTSTGWDLRDPVQAERYKSMVEDQTPTVITLVDDIGGLTCLE